MFQYISKFSVAICKQWGEWAAFQITKASRRISSQDTTPSIPYSRCCHMCGTISCCEHVHIFSFAHKDFSSYATPTEFSFPAESSAHDRLACASQFCSRLLLILRHIFSYKESMGVKIRSWLVCIIFQKEMKYYFQALLQSCAVKKSILHCYEDHGYSVILS